MTRGREESRVSQDERGAMRVCLLSTLIHLTLHPDYSLTPAMLAREKQEAKSIAFIVLTGLETFGFLV